MIIELFNNESTNSCFDLFIKTFNSSPWNEKWEINTTKEKLEPILNDDNFLGFIGKIEGKLVSMVLGIINKSFLGSTYNIKELCVDPDFQIQGLGTKLLNELENELLKKNITRISLITARNSIAEKFYNKNGFNESKGLIIMNKIIK